MGKNSCHAGPEQTKSKRETLCKKGIQQGRRIRRKNQIKIEIVHLSQKSFENMSLQHKCFNKSKAVSRRSAAVPQSHIPIVAQSHSTTVPQFQSPTVPQPHSAHCSRVDEVSRRANSVHTCHGVHQVVLRDGAPAAHKQCMDSLGSQQNKWQLASGHMVVWGVAAQVAHDCTRS